MWTKIDSHNWNPSNKRYSTAILKSVQTHAQPSSTLLCNCSQIQNLWEQAEAKKNTKALKSNIATAPPAGYVEIVLILKLLVPKKKKSDELGTEYVYVYVYVNMNLYI